MVFKLKRLDKSGSAVYSVEGVRGSLYISKGLLAAEAPQELDIPFDGFTPPGTVRTVTPKNPTPEQIEKVQAQLAKAQQNEAKAKERAEKARVRAAKYIEVPAEPVTA
jgi:hypothetical protein